MGSGVVQLAVWSILTPEVHGSNQSLANFYEEHLFPVNCIEKTKMNEKEAWNG